MSSSWGAVRTDKGASVLGKAGDGPGSMQWLAHIGFLLPSRARAWALNAERLGRKLLPPAGSTSSALASEVTLGPASASRARGEGVGCIGGVPRARPAAACAASAPTPLARTQSWGRTSPPGRLGGMAQRALPQRNLVLETQHYSNNLISFPLCIM